jgi:hypothetical protein
MPHANWSKKKDILCYLIKKCSNHFGRDDAEWLRDYAKEILEEHKEDLDEVILSLLHLNEVVGFCSKSEFERVKKELLRLK